MLKAHELMIGDWISYGAKQFAKITNLSSDMDCSDINPIPLTEEILEANGFHKDIYWCLYQRFFTLEKYRGVNRFRLFSSERRSFITDISYVHELQHALRLYGLDELADNFNLMED